LAASKIHSSADASFVLQRTFIHDRQRSIK
jgi:hypothetical protein